MGEPGSVLPAAQPKDFLRGEVKPEGSVILDSRECITTSARVLAEANHMGWKTLL